MRKKTMNAKQKFEAAKKAYEQARNAERRHEGSRAATDYCDRQMHVALAAMLAEEASK